jgi:carbamoylphosphate synthase small subunit
VVVVDAHRDSLRHKLCKGSVQISRCLAGRRSRVPQNLYLSNIFDLCYNSSYKMSSLDFIDYSPQQPEPVPPLANASNVILIDNFDSFSWNIYQYLALEGANVTVFRNDEISVEKLAGLRPTQLVISPGPGHPRTDSGISRDAIKYFAGKIPIFGVCMGQ